MESALSAVLWPSTQLWANHSIHARGLSHSAQAKTKVMFSQLWPVMAVRLTETVSVGAGAAQREARERLPDAARRRDAGVVLVWRTAGWCGPRTLGRRDR
jgi:hypothetical protein